MSIHVVLSAVRHHLEDALVARGAPTLAVVPSEVAPTRRASGAGYAIRTVDDWDDYTQLAALAVELEPLGVLSVSTGDEQCVRAAAMLRALLGLPGQALGAAVAATDKAVMKRWLAAAGARVADHRVVRDLAGITDAADRIGWPVVVKPRRGFGAVQTHLVRDGEHLATLRASGAFGEIPLGEGFGATEVGTPLADRAGGILVERAIAVATEFHCELVRYRGEEIYCLPGRYRAPLLDGANGYFGASTLDPRSPEAATVTAMTRAAADTVGLETGFAHVEVLLDADGAWFLGEIATRPGGSMVPTVLRLRYGLDVVAVQTDLAQGIRPRIDWRADPRPISWVSVPAAPGRVTAMTSTDEIRALPGVVEAMPVVRPGQVASGAVGTLIAAAHVFCTGTDEAEAEHRAVEAAAAWQVDTAPDLPADIGQPAGIERPLESAGRD